MIKTINSELNNVQVGSIIDSQFDTLLGENFSDAKKVVIVDENTQEKCWPYLLTSFEQLKEAELIVLPDGESNKSIEICYQVWQALSDYKVKRGDLIINLGGGVITDMGGFIAAVYKRGLSFINVPTTLLSMVDASVGGKTGVNLLPWKNQLGTFSLPYFTICDPIFLQTLEKKEVASGKAEMLKHGLIEDAAYYQKLVKTKFIETTDIIFRAIEIKAGIVDRDPEENGERKKLNFGHTVGHAIEGLCTQLEIEVTHGACVSWGMIVESKLSSLMNGLSESDYDHIKDTLINEYGQVPLKKEDTEELVELMYQDKKNTNDMINCTLLTEIGNCEIDQMISTQQMHEALSELF